MSFGKRLNQILLERDMSPAALSKILGWNTGVISQYLNKPDRDPRLSTAIKIADALDVSLDYLAGRRESKTVRMSRDESALLDNYRTAPPSGKASIERIARLEAGSQGQEAHVSSSEEASA